MTFKKRIKAIVRREQARASLELTQERLTRAMEAHRELTRALCRGERIPLHRARRDLELRDLDSEK